jgi:DNA-directed RNA polymerase subunit H (RpoH/RPB5)
MSRETVHATCLEMLKQREYSIIDDEDTYITALKPDGTQMAVFFHEGQKFDTKGMKETLFLMNQMVVKHALIIYKDDVTPAVRQTLLRSVEMKFELFAKEDLKINITKHRYQPIFQRLEEKEAIVFKKEFGTKFGTLRVDKPISRFYDYQRGDVIRILRKDGYINYRIVKG